MPVSGGVEGLLPLLEILIERMAGGSVTTFARRLDLSKSGVWHWVRKGGSPSLPAWLAIARHSGLPLRRLFAGDLSDWTPPVEPVQLTLPLLTSPRKGIRSRELDWDAIREQLRTLLAEETPITLVEACRRTGVEHKLLYLRANAETRALVDRSRRYQEALRQGKVGRLQEQVGQLVQERLEEGYEGISAREIWARLDDELKSVRHTYRHVAKAVVANDA
ncbi:hypothetical protein [Propionivibrio soli]|uniref:hypothetical protein n=1 Tax=Propionivibrio soli TaxID=2976531 RepID=UPI0021E9064D|nr:hypothetical protein [Propionivibrio soli]